MQDNLITAESGVMKVGSDKKFLEFVFSIKDTTKELDMSQNSCFNLIISKVSQS